MKLLIGGSSSKFFHLKDFADELENIGIECKLVHDTDFADGYPSRKLSTWLKRNNKFENLINDFKPDIIFVDRQRHFGLEALKYNIPLFVYLRGNYWEEMKMAKKTLYSSPPKKLAINKWDSIGSQVFQGSKIILPICKHLENVVKNYYPKKPTSVLYQGITPENWFHTDGMKLKHPCVGLLQGAVIFEKTKELLTLTKVLEKMPGVTFYWVGDGPYRDDVLQELRSFDNFHWLEKFSWEEYPENIRQFLTEIDVYALPTGMDTLPLSCKEAMAMQNPVIATNVGGISEMVCDGKTGFLIDEGDADQWVDKISFLLKNKNVAQEMGKSAREFIIEEFSWDVIAKRFVSVIQKLK